jgi:hypothetical protein
VYRIESNVVLTDYVLRIKFRITYIARGSELLRSHYYRIRTDAPDARLVLCDCSGHANQVHRIAYGNVATVRHRIAP